MGSPKHFLQVSCFEEFFVLKLSRKVLPLFNTSSKFDLLFTFPREIVSSYARQHGTTLPSDKIPKISLSQLKLSLMG